MNHEVPKITRGLVLEGGGAKGAYQAGCFRALKEAGLHFDLIAGTSVGALNAVLFSALGAEGTQSLWSDLDGIGSVFRPRRSRLFGILLLPCALIYAFVNSDPCLERELLPRPSEMLRAFLRAVAVAPVYLAALNAVLVCGAMAVVAISTKSMLFLLLCILPWYFLFQFATADEVLGMRNRRRQYFTCGSIVAFLAVLGLLSRRLEALHISSHPMVHAAAAGSRIWNAVLVLPLMVILAAYAVWAIVHRARWSLFATEPLQLRARDALTDNPLKIPVLVTVAEAQPVFDPDNPQWMRRALGLSFATRRVPQLVYVPYYVELESDIDDTILALLASSALPFGIVPSVSIGTHRFVDGGVVDNSPINPVVGKGCDEIVIIRLQPLVEVPEEWAAAHWKAIDRLIRVSAFGRLVDSSDDESKEHIWKSKLPLREAHLPRLIVISPKHSLGGLVEGTLNFNRQHIRELMELGYQDTRVALANAGLPVSTDAPDSLPKE